MKIRPNSYVVCIAGSANVLRKLLCKLNFTPLSYFATGGSVNNPAANEARIRIAVTSFVTSLLPILKLHVRQHVIHSTALNSSEHIAYIV